MEGELIEIREFLARCPPFDGLPETVLDGLPYRLMVRYLRRGSPFPPGEEDPALWLIRGGAVEFRGPDQQLIEKLGEGELHFDACLDAPTLPGQQGKVVEDSLFYLLPCSELQALRQQHGEFSQYFEQDLRSRLQHAIVQMQQHQGGDSRLMQVKVDTLIRREPVTIGAEASIRKAAQRMSSERASSLLVVANERLVGILTDRDLRQRVIAAGFDVERPLGGVMTCDPQTLSASATVFEAMIHMTRLHVHHLPILDGQGRLQGVITASDILNHYNLNTVSLASTIRHSQDLDALVVASRQLPELQAQLIRGGMGADQLTQALCAVTDGITRRLLEMAEETLGPAPIPYAWVVCGSQARREQTAVSDQDNALLLDNGYGTGHAAYFEALARFVSDGLARCGFVYCPGNVMATNPVWRQPRKVWEGYFRNWIENPDPKALMHASIFFDMRALHGEPGLFSSLQQEVLRQSRKNSIFLAHLAANALHYRPPLGFFRQLVLIHDGEHDDTLDIKHRGVIPIVDMVRVHALAAGLPATNTRERIQAAEACGELSHDGAQDLLYALEFIATLRARHQAQQHLEGLPMDNYLRPDSLSRPERNQLKDAFFIISILQEALEQRYQSARIA
jgi:CBS domain-containing protein